MATFTTAVAQQAANSFLEKGDEYIAAGKPSQARGEYEKAIKAGANLSGDFSRSRNLGLAYLNGSPHNFAKAATWLNAALKLRADDEEVHLGLAQALSWGGKSSDAIPQWRWLWQKDSQNMDYALGLANALYVGGNKRGCFEHLQHLVERVPSNVAVRLEYARFLGYEKKFAEAGVQYQSVLQIDPSNLDAQVGMAKLLSWQNSFDAALEKYDAVLKHSPHFYPALVGKAYTLLWMGKNEEARANFQLASKQNPRDPEVATPLKKLNAEARRLAASSQPATAPASPATKSEVPPVAEVATAVIEKPTEAAPSAAPSDVKEEEPPAPAPVDPIADLMAQAEAAAGRGDFAEAIAGYKKVLALKPQDPQASLRLARVLSWNKQYDESLAQYGSVIGDLQRQDAQARLERARVLSWAQRLDDSIREYQSLATDLDRAPTAGISSRDVHLELAQVQSWAKQYDQSLAELDRLIPAKPGIEDKPALVLKGRVLSYARRYQQALATYDMALALDPSDKDARFGKAQTLFWSGDLRRSRPMLVNIVNDEPGNTDARVALAAVENGTGDAARALSLLNELPDQGEVHTLKTAIRQSLRPILRERFGWENDVETPPGTQPSTTTRGLRLSSSLEFSATPKIRMEIVNTVTRGTTSNPTLARYGSTDFAQETMVRATMRVNPWLRIMAGAGVGTTGGGNFCPQLSLGTCTETGTASAKQHPVFEFHPVVTVNRLRIDVTTTRHIADYTPLAVHDNVAQLQQSAAVTYDFNRIRVGGEYRYLHYTVDPSDRTVGLASQLSANSHGGLVYATPKFYRSDRLTIEGGVRYEAFGYDGGAEQIAQSIPAGYGSAGFFTPRVYERYAGTGHIELALQSRFHLELDGTFGPQRIFGFASLQAPAAKWGTTGTTTIQLRRDMGRLQPYIAYDFFSTATAAGPTLTNGSYSSHSVTGGFSWRF